MSPDAEPISRAEARLVVLLELLRSESPRAADSLTERVMRTARWQYALRGAIVIVSDLVAVLVEGFVFVFGLRDRGRA